RLAAGRVSREKMLIGGSGILLLVLFFSFSSAWYSNSRLITHFTFVISQNTFFIAGFATLVLWVWNLFNNAEDRIATQFLNVLAVYFALIFLVYWLEQARPFYRGHNDDLFSMAGA